MEYINNDTKRLYHKNVFWKHYFDRASGRLIYNQNLDFSYHLCNQKYTDRNHSFSLMRLARIIMNIQKHSQYYTIYEVQTIFDNVLNMERIIKVCVRTEYDDTYDISIVISEDCIVTAWLNDKYDRHNTLDDARYYKKF